MGWTDEPRRDPVIAVVGRGPVGMTLALRLAGLGVRTVLIDVLGTDVDPGSKAVVMHQHAVEVLGTVGLREDMLAEGVAWTVGRTYRRDKELFAITMRVAPGELPLVLNLPQARTEELLLQRVMQNPLIETCFYHRLVGLEQDTSGCHLTVQGPDGPRHVFADFVAGCDGSRSATRKLAGVAFSGYGHDDVFLINDITARLPFPDERRFYFDPAFNPGRTVLIHPQGPDQWHIDFQIGPEAGDSSKSPADVRKRVSSVIGDAEFSVNWTTTYQFKQLVADHFQAGRVFLVGDAAHLTSPYGARGLNSGLADADNLAWKLAQVISGRSALSLLDTYETERRPAALENLRITGATARFMSPLTWRQRLRRDGMLAMAARIPALLRFVDSGHFYQPAVYGRAGERSRLPLDIGTLVPDVPLDQASGGRAPARLADILQSGPVVMLVPTAADNDAAVDCAQQLTEAGHRCLVITREAAVDVPVAVPLSSSIDTTWWPRISLRRAIAVIVRPDRYVAARTGLDGRLYGPSVKEWVAAETSRLGWAVEPGFRWEKTR